MERASAPHHATMTPRSGLAGSAIWAGALAAGFSIGFAGAAAAGPVEDLRPGQWYEVPGSHLRDVAPKEGQFSGTWGVEGPPAVINDWSGGAYDSKRDRLMVWGGGHGGYAGNEIYVFDLGTLAWKRLNSPSTPPGVDVAYAPDGAPTSRHTYGYLAYAPPPLDRFCTFGGAGFFQSGQTGTDHVDCFDLDAGKWEVQRFPDVAGNHIGALSVHDPVTGHLWYHASFDATWMELDTGTKQWTSRGSSYYLDYYKTAEIDPRRRKLVAVGKGEVLSWDISTPGTVSLENLSTTGATAIIDASSPGLAYDPVSDKLVAWSGGAEVYTLDLDARVWSKVAPAPTNTATPTAPNGNGTFGRFRYMPSRNAFIVVNGADDDVFIYKLAAGAGVGSGSASDAGSYDGGADRPATSPDAAAGAGGSGDAGGGDGRVGAGAGGGAGAGRVGPAPSHGGCSCELDEEPAKGQRPGSAPLVLAAAWLAWRARRPAPAS